MEEKPAMSAATQPQLVTLRSGDVEATVKGAVEVDHTGHEALIATPLLSAEIIGECRFVRSADQPDTAEAGVTVVDAWQGAGSAPRCSRA
jgi:hypothetical protein